MKKNFTAVFTLLCLLFLLSSLSYAVEFSADSFFVSNGRTMSGKMYGREDRFRMEIKEPRKAISITRMDKKVVWTIMPSRRMYMEMPYNAEHTPTFRIKMPGEIDRKLLGKEKVNGHPTKKYLISYRLGSGIQRIYQWWATDINFPVKTADADNKWVQEYKNISIGHQPDSLFEIPTGYSILDLPLMPGRMGNRMKFR